MEKVNVLNQMTAENRHLSYLNTTIIEAKHGTKRVSMTMQVNICADVKVPFSKMARRLAAPRSFLMILSIKMVAASFGRCKKLQKRGAVRSHRILSNPKKLKVDMITFPTAKGTAVSLKNLHPKINEFLIRIKVLGNFR